MKDLERSHWLGEVRRRALRLSRRGQSGGGRGFARQRSAKTQGDLCVRSGHGRRRWSLRAPQPLAETLRDVLVPIADIATPNRFELEWMAGAKLDDLRSIMAARARRRAGDHAGHLHAGHDDGGHRQSAFHPLGGAVCRASRHPSIRRTASATSRRPSCSPACSTVSPPPRRCNRQPRQSSRSWRAQPSAAPTSCSSACCDSRAAPEAIFDAGPGRAVRGSQRRQPRAALCARTTSTMATSAALEFAVQSLKVREHRRHGPRPLWRHPGSAQSRMPRRSRPAISSGSWMSLVAPAAEAGSGSTMIDDDGRAPDGRSSASRSAIRSPISGRSPASKILGGKGQAALGRLVRYLQRRTLGHEQRHRRFRTPVPKSDGVGRVQARQGRPYIGIRSPSTLEIPK